MDTVLKYASDSELLSLSDGEDGYAFSELVDRYKAGLSSFLWSFMKQDDLVEDVVQETFLRFYAKRDRFDSRRPVKPWLFTIAANTARDVLRKSKCHPAVSIGSLIRSEESSLGDILNIFTSYEDNPLEHLEQTERLDVMYHIVQQMPPKQRDILLLAYYEGLSYRDISHRLSIPVGTVKSRLHMAVRSVTAAWSVQYPQR